MTTTPPTPELMPCPLCEHPEIDHHTWAGFYYGDRGYSQKKETFRCLKCGLELNVCGDEISKEKAFEQWNTRTLPAAQPVGDVRFHMVEQYGTMMLDGSTLGAYWMCNGKKFNHEPTHEEIEAAYEGEPGVKYAVKHIEVDIPDAQPVGDEKPWTFCPECGCEEYKRADWNNENECVKCKQSWFPDIDYTSAVKANLAAFKAAQQPAPEAAKNVLDRLNTFLGGTRFQSDGSGDEEYMELSYSDAATIRASLQPPPPSAGVEVVDFEQMKMATSYGTTISSYAIGFNAALDEIKKRVPTTTPGDGKDAG